MAAQAFEVPLVTYTIFPDVWPKTKTERADVAWDELVARVKDSPTYIDKRHCPLISIAEYGELMSSGDNPILRHGANITRVFGTEIDYDGEQMPIEEAACKFKDAGICALLYTSPSHKTDKPRWRALLPFSEPHHPDKRMEYTGRANRILGGVATRESFTLSQSFYIGRVTGAEYIVIDIQGVTIDFAVDLEPLYWVDKHSDGGTPYNKRTDADLRSCFTSDSGGRYEAMLSLSSRWAARGMARDDIEAALFALLEQGGTTRNKDGIDLTTRVAPMAKSAVLKFGETRAQGSVDPEQEPPAPVDDGRFAPIETLHDEATDPLVVDSVEPEQPKSLRSPIRWALLAGKTPPDRDWVINHWIPAGEVTLMSGPGGAGKTGVCQALGSCVALGSDYVDSVPSPKRVLMWACEDSLAELWRRQVAICKWSNTPIEQFEEKLILQSYHGESVELSVPVRDQLVRTKMLEELRQQIGDYKAELVILDNIARLFAGNENARYQVSTFIAHLSWAAQSTNAAILLLGHPAKQVGSEFSGSTAWEGAVRTRLYLGTKHPDEKLDPNSDEGIPADDGMRYLCKRKANYSTKDYRRIQYTDGVMAPEDVERFQTPGKVDSEYAKGVVRSALRQLKSMSEFGVASKSSPSYLPKLAATHKMLDRLSVGHFTAVMNEMRKSGEIVVSQVGVYPNRSPRMGFTEK